MGDPKKFDAGHVSSLAAEIATMTKEASELRQAARRADEDAGRAECRLRNKQAEFTRAVESQLDHSIIHHPVRHEVRE